MKKDIFLPLDEQVDKIIKYNEWLKKDHSQLLVSDNEIADFTDQIKGIKNEDSLVFYCHGGDVVLSARLAWEYICSYRKRAWKSPYVRFEAGCMKSADNEPARPSGFFIKKLPIEDRKGIGKKFQGKSVANARENLGDDWGMGFEGIQVLGITHPHYPELMDGAEIPFIDLPGLALAPGGVGGFCGAPYLYFSGGELGLYDSRVVHTVPLHGSGSLQQCQV